ncbi:hypothetical protein T10_265 [Trichinella papuae]|uniref:Uncharacterized protein n=1 Tax=Trichinella papuae TaxID=268474 RepID=A0A0V1MZV9_9BILA|nr:hypothetical protein T10_265 [Trichinella papuae]
MSTTRKRKVLSLEQKLEVCRLVESGESFRKIAESFGVGPPKIVCSDNQSSIVLYIPSLETGLLSAQGITCNGYKIKFQDDTCLITYQKEVVAEAKLDGSLFMLKRKLQMDTTLSVHTHACLHKWHRRMGHRDSEAVRRLNKEQLVNGIEICECDAENDCEICLTAVDRIKDYVATLHTRFGRNPVTLRTDNGREYINQRLRNFLSEKGIAHLFSAPYTKTKWCSRKEERFFSLNGEGTLLGRSGVHGSISTKSAPRPKYFQDTIPALDWNQTQQSGQQGIGYGGTTKGYRLLNPTTNEIWISRSVKIIEDDSHMKSESAVPKGAIEQSREYEDTPKLPKKEVNVNIEDIFGPQQEESTDKGESTKEGIETPTLRCSRRINKGGSNETANPKTEKWIAGAEEEKGIIELKCCPSDKMMADSLTKPVCKQKTESFAKKVGLEGYGQENEKGCWRKAFS